MKQAPHSPAGFERFHPHEFETQLEHLISRQTTITVQEHSALDNAMKSREMRRWIRGVWDLGFDPHITLTSIHIFAMYLNGVHGFIRNYQWQGYASICLAFKLERDDDMTDSEILKIMPRDEKSRENLTAAELDVSYILRYRFHQPKVSEFAYVLLGMVSENLDAFKDVMQLLQWCSIRPMFIQTPPIVLAAAVVGVILPHKLKHLVQITPNDGVESIYQNIMFELL
jgi:hypothetical protein